jgi:hypothetical protein
MAKKWNDLIRTAQRVGHDVGMMSRGYRETAESEARLRQSKLQQKLFKRGKETEDLNLYMTIIKDRTGTWSPEMKQAAEQNIRKHPRFRQLAESLGGAPMRGKGWGTGLGEMPSGMTPQEIKIGAEGQPSITYGYTTSTTLNNDGKIIKYL